MTHQDQRTITDRLIAARQARLERVEQNDNFNTAIDMFGPEVVMAMMNGEDMLTLTPIEWDYE